MQFAKPTIATEINISLLPIGRTKEYLRAVTSDAAESEEHISPLTLVRVHPINYIVWDGQIVKNVQ